MPAKKGFSDRAWEEIINAGMNGAWIDGAIAAAKKSPDAPFADAGPLLEAILKRGVTRDQLCRLARAIRYMAVFETVQLAAEEELDGEQLEGVHEELLMADPSGRDGRPGSWPVEPAPPPKRAPARATPSKPAKASAKRRGKPAGPDAPLLALPKGDDFAFARDGSRLWLAHTSISASTVRGVELPGGEPFAEFNSLPNLRGLACAPDGKRVAAGSHGGAVALHDGVTGKGLWTSPKTGEETRYLAYAPDGSMVLNSGSQTCVRRRDAKTGKELPPLDFGPGWLAGALAFSPDGRTLAVSAVHVPGAAHVAYWDWRAAKELGRHALPGGRVSDLAFLPDGRGLLVGGYKEVAVRDVTSHEQKCGVSFEESLRGVSLHPGGRLLAAGTYNGSQVREFPSGKLLKELDTTKTHPSHWAFSPDGRHVLLVASPKSFMWDVKTLLAGPMAVSE